MDEDYYEVSNRDNKKDLSNHVAPEIPDWVEIYNTIDIQSFENKSGNALVIKSITPFQIFMKFIDYRLLEMFTQFTRAHVEFDLIKKGKYQGSQQPEIRTINQTYIRCYISVLILMGLQNQGNRKSSWKFHEFYNNPIISNICSYSIFKNIDNYFKTADPEFAHLESRFKIHHMMDMFKRNLNKTYNPGSDICINEISVKSRSRRTKKYKYKLVYLCDSQTGYIWNLDFFSEKLVNLPYSHSKIRLTDGLNVGHHHLYIKTKVSVFNWLKILKKNIIGIIWKIKESCLELPQYFHDKNNSFFMYKHLICCIDALKSPVYYITNLTLTKIEFDTKKEEEEDMLKETPLVIKNHKKNTIGAKIYKKNHKKYKIRLNPRKWWKSIFFDCLNVALTNSYIIYNEMHDSLAVEYSSEDDFRLDVALGFVDFYSDFSNKYQLPYKNLMPSLPQMIRLPANIGHGYCECCRRGKLKDHWIKTKWMCPNCKMHISKRCYVSHSCDVQVVQNAPSLNHKEKNTIIELD